MWYTLSAASAPQENEEERDRSMLIRTVAAAVAATLTSAASADTVNLQFAGTGSGQNVRITIGASTFNCFAGQLRHNFSAGNGVAAGLTGTKVTFCTDLTEYVSSGGATYTVAPIASLPQTSGWPAMGATRAQAVYDLYAAAAGTQSASGASADLASAFQIVLWEIVYDYSGSASSLNLTAGNLRATRTDGSALGSGVMTQVNALFAAIGSGAAQLGLMGLSNNGAQDQIVEVPTVIPLPPAAWAGLSGLGLAFAIRRRAARR
jgi:hypothetical protein